MTIEIAVFIIYAPKIIYMCTVYTVINKYCEEFVMANITISVPKELKEKMNRFPEINWSRLTSILLSQKIKRLELLKELDEMLIDSKLTDDDCIDLGRRLKKEILKKY